VWYVPALIAVTVVRPVTGTGVELAVVVPFPSLPSTLLPQHSAVPFARTAHVWFPPALIAVTVVRPVTGTGVELAVVVPFPRAPLRPRPQHAAVLFVSTAHVCVPPALTVTEAGLAAPAPTAPEPPRTVAAMTPRHATARRRASRVRMDRSS
jgi:hypothetical protein